MYCWILLTLSCAIGLRAKAGPTVSGPRLQMFWQVSHFNNSSPSFSNASRSISTRELTFQLPELHGGVSRKNISISSSPRQTYMSSGPKYSSHQIRINDPYSMNHQQQLNRRINSTPLILAEVPEAAQAASVRKWNNSVPAHGRIALKSDQEANEPPNENLNDNNSSFYGNMMLLKSVQEAEESTNQIWKQINHSPHGRMMLPKSPQKPQHRSIQTWNDNHLSNAKMTLKSTQEAREASVDAWVGNSSRSEKMPKEDLPRDNTCLNKQTLDACLEKTTSGTPGVRGLPHTPAQLQHMCHLFKGGMKCVDDYTTLCLSPEKRALLEDNIVGARSFLAFLCDDPRFQRDYLSHALCMKAVSALWDDCYLHFQYLLRLELRATADSDFDAMCCSRQKFLMCVDKAADIACNLEDALFLRKVTATLSYTEHRTLMCQREYFCSRGHAYRKRITGQLEITALLFVWLWSHNAEE